MFAGLAVRSVCLDSRICVCVCVCAGLAVRSLCFGSWVLWRGGWGGVCVCRCGSEKFVS